jgi:hypothetical protein
MARQAPAGLLGIHINLPAIVQPEIAGCSPKILSSLRRFCRKVDQTLCSEL